MTAVERGGAGTRRRHRRHRRGHRGRRLRAPRGGAGAPDRGDRQALHPRRHVLHAHHRPFARERRTARRSTAARSPAGSRPCSDSCWCRCSGSPTTPTPRSASISRCSSSSTPPPSSCSRGSRTASPGESRRWPRPRCGRSHRWRCRWRSAGSRRRWRSSCSVRPVAPWIWANDRPATRPRGRRRCRRRARGARARSTRCCSSRCSVRCSSGGVRADWSCPARSRARWCSRPWWIWCTIQFGTPIPTSGDAAHSARPGAPVLPRVDGAGRGRGRRRTVRRLALVAGVAQRPSGRRRAWCSGSMVLALVAARRVVGAASGHAAARGGRAARCSPRGCSCSTRGSAWRGTSPATSRRWRVSSPLILAVGIARVWRTRGTWRIPAFVATAVVLLIGVVAAVARELHQLTAHERDELGVRHRHRLPRRSPRGRRSPAATGRSSARGRAARSATSPTTASPW